MCSWSCRLRGKRVAFSLIWRSHSDRPGAADCVSCCGTRRLTILEASFGGASVSFGRSSAIPAETLLSHPATRSRCEFDNLLVDALEVASAMSWGIGTLEIHQLQTLCELYTGEPLEGLVIERCPEFNLWLTGQQSRYSAFRAALLQRLVEKLPPDSSERLAAVEKWVEVAPLDYKAQLELLCRLAERGRIDACKRQLTAAAKLYQAENSRFRADPQGLAAIV